MLILASASPRRAQLLTAVGIAFETITQPIDEAPFEAEPPDVYVARLAQEKARVVAARRAGDGRPVLGADTTVVVDGEILGKPVDESEAAHMLQRLQGRTHEVLTGVALLSPSAPPRVAVDRALVTVRPMTAEDVAAYLATGEWRDKAGAYGIQGTMARYIASISGSYTTIVGLPVALVCRWVMGYSVNNS
jgi:septum formation protein